MFFSLGLLLNEWLNMFLKYTIKEPRPALRDNYYVKYGMPSSHAQFCFFFTTYTILFLFKRYERTPKNNFNHPNFHLLCRLHHNTQLEKIFRGLIISFCLVNTALVCYGRVYLMYHTVNQVIVGSIIGTICGFLYFFFVHSILTPYVFPKIVTWKISELFLIRDTTLIPNILFFEYTATRQESRARLRKSFQKMQ